MCFAAMYMILRNLLFRPILALMDKRQEKIDSASKAKEDAEKQLEEQRRRFLSEHEALTEKLRKDREAEAEKMRMEGKDKLEDAKKEQASLVESYRSKTDAEYDEDMEKAADSIEAAADLFLSRLFAN